VLVVNATQAAEKVQKELRARFFAEQAQLPRPMQEIEGIEHVSELASRTGTPVSVMQWNVLADGLCANSPHSGGFGLCPAQWLTAEHRRSTVLKAISTRSPDIVALQEADNWDWWKAQMGKIGYQGFERLDDKSPCLTVAVNEPKFPDGLALFWRKGMFKLSERVVEQDPENWSTEGKNKFMIARLRVQKTGEYVVVCNAHLDSRKTHEGAKVRLKQTRRMLAKLEDMAVPTAWDTTGKTATAVFVCCDLNEPHGQESHLEIRNREVLKATYRTKAGMRDVMRDSGSHAYEGYITSYKVRTGTYKHGKHKYAVDHMFHCGGAVPLAVARMPTEAEIGPCGLPAPNWPSDHMYVYCEYLICPTSALPTSPHRVIKNPMGSGGELDEMRQSLVSDVEISDAATESDKKLLRCICAVLAVLVCIIGSVVADFW
jgi:mRNA deadenylase 3'-5' endonuclease subunit Ccr4